MRQILEKRKFFTRRSNVFLSLNLLFIFIIFLIGLKPDSFRRQITPKDIAYYNNKTLIFKGLVCEEADLDYKSRRLTVCVDNPVHGRVLVSTRLYPVYNYGDYLEISGKLQAPPKIDGFDYDAYLARYDIYSVMYFASLKKLSGYELSLRQSIYQRLLSFKQYLASLLNRYLPEPEVGFAKAILLGYRRAVLREQVDVFARIGLSHMIAISGSHIAILSSIVINFFLFLGLSRRYALRFVFVFLFIYPIITGLSASAVRASIMGTIAFLAVYYQRPNSIVRALVFAATLMLLFNPKLLSSDIGFQLSFLAILGIIYIYPIGEEKTRRWLEGKKLRRRVYNFWKTIFDTINLTMVSQLVILPITLINFKQFSIIAPLANILIIWAFPLLLITLLIGLVLTAIFPIGGTLFFSPAYIILKYISDVSQWLARPSWAAISITKFNWTMGAGYYLILILAIYRYRKRKMVKIKKRPD